MILLSVINGFSVSDSSMITRSKSDSTCLGKHVVDRGRRFGLPDGAIARSFVSVHPFSALVRLTVPPDGLSISPSSLSRAHPGLLLAQGLSLGDVAAAAAVVAVVVEGEAPDLLVVRLFPRHIGGMRLILLLHF